jgi:hypothetical protein
MPTLQRQLMLDADRQSGNIPGYFLFRAPETAF